MNFLYLLDLLPRSINFKIKKNKIKIFYNVGTIGYNYLENLLEKSSSICFI